MTFRPERGLFPGNKAIVLALFVFFLAASPASSDPFGFLPAKEARKAKEALAALDASISEWNDSFARFADASWNARAAVAKQEDSSAYGTLVAEGASGAWKAGKGASLSVLKADVRKRAARLESILNPRVASAGVAELKELLAALCSRGSRLLGCAAECFEFATRSAALDTQALRFAVKSALGVVPEEAAQRFVPDDVDPATLPYGRDAELAAAAERLRNLRRAASAVREASGVLAVPELPWTPEGIVKAEEAARLLELLPAAERARALECAAVPGVELLPAFLSGLSPEEFMRWRLERGLSSRAARVFLAAAREGPVATPGVDPAAGRTALAVSLAELERDVAKEKISGIGLLSRLTDPALRAVLLQDSAPSGLGAEVEEAWKSLAAALEKRLSGASVESGGEGISVGKATAHVETERIEAPGGFVTIRAYSVSEEGKRTPVPSDSIERILNSIFEASGGSTDPSGIPLSVRLGILVDAGPEESVKAEWMRADDPVAFAALNCLVSRRLDESALNAGVSSRTLYGRDLERITAVCLLRCRGLAGDEDVARASAAAGGPDRTVSSWKAAFRMLESARRAVATYTEEGAEP